LRRLVPCDSINLGTVDLETEQGFHFSLDGFLMPRERRELLPRFKHQHPMLELARKVGQTPPLRFSDFYTRRVFEEHPIYRECYRGFTHSMLTFGVATMPGVNVSFVLSRADTEFSETDCENLKVLQPLIASIIRQRILQDALQSTAMQGQSVGLIYGSGPHIHIADSLAMRLLVTHFPGMSRHRVPVDLWRAAVRPAGHIATVKSLPDGGRLCTRISPRLNEWRLDLWEEASAIPAQQLEHFGLTRRQAEVFQWLNKGKANAEIAMILGISPRTVEKHMEAIYRQLGVENRLAACRLGQSLRARGMLAAG
jgi:DNA-binding CsgD family transcriptional regulator